MNSSKYLKAPFPYFGGKSLIADTVRTIITSNLSPENIEQVYGERLGSRLKTFLTIRLGGKDKRG